MSQPATEIDRPSTPLQHALDHARHLVPSQSPLDRFVHHNPLHAFEAQPFGDAVLEAAAIYGAEAYWPEDTYRAAFMEGRIRQHDMEWAVDRFIDDGPIAGVTDRRQLALALMRHPIRPLRDESLDWALTETDVLQTPRPDLRIIARAALLDEAGGDPARAVTKLWEVVKAYDPQSTHPVATARGVRIRDRILSTGTDPDALVHGLLIRWSAAYLDHGVSFWPMAERDRGFLASFLTYFAQPVDLGRNWLTTAHRTAAQATAEAWSAEQLCEHVLQAMGHPVDTWDEVVTQTLLALRGWAGMFQRLADRPDTAPSGLGLPTDLAEFLAVRLLLDHSAAAYVLGHDTDQRTHADALPLPVVPPTEPAPAWMLFQLAQILGIGAHSLEALGDERVATLLAEAEAIPELLRRQIWHEAYERHFRAARLDAISVHARRVARQEPVPCRVQAAFCIDDREESFRRHLEEAAPWVETIGYAGNYGISMYYRSAATSRREALGPAGFAPKHLVVEQAPQATSRLLGHVADRTHVATQNAVQGTFVALGGLFAAVPMAWRILNPRSHARSSAVTRTLGPLMYKRDGDACSEDGLLLGFSFDERVELVASGLVTMGLVDRMADLVVCFGHGSTSVNNPHEAGYNCGACGGGRGGPNARLFAAMANEPEIREALRARGLAIPDTTWFVGGYHNTSEDGIDLYDLDRLPSDKKPLLDEFVQALDTTRAVDALERCRKFDSAPLTFTPAQALEHVEARAADLAQARPEYNHATNGMALVGRRSWTRGLFLDRRAFLVTYEPDLDPDGDVLAGLLANVVPVGAGINLEYLFSTLDNRLYGCGTKLPHNITGLVGVMDGHASDLRTGLNHQMIEIHEPVRLLCVVEATPERLLAIAAKHPAVGRLVTGGWVQLASLDADTGEMQLFEDGAFRPWKIENAALPIVPSSTDWFRGTRGLLPCATIQSGRGDA